MSNKVYLNSIIVLAIIIAAVAIFGASNHFLGYYDPNGKINKNSENKEKTPDEKKPDDKKPDDKKPDDKKPDDKPAATDKEINGYKCKYSNCEILSGTDLIKEKYLFIVDGTENVVFFDTTSKETKETYKSVSIAGNNFIVKNQNNMYAIINVSENVSEVVPYEYTYIDYLSTKDNYILTKNNSSFVTDNKGKAITLTYNAQIMDYNNLYIITRTATGEYHIFNFNNSTELTEYVNSGRIFIELVENYVGVVTSDYKYQLYDFQNKNKLIAEQQLQNSYTKFHAVINSSNKLEIYADDNLINTIDL